MTYTEIYKPMKNLSDDGSCLFTGEKLTRETKIEHAIPRSLCGRIRSRRVTCSTFNEKSSVFDLDLAKQYKLILCALAPLLPREFNPGRIDVKLDNGWSCIQENGITKLKDMVVTDWYPSNKPKTCYLPDDPQAIRRILKKNKLHNYCESLIHECLPGDIANYDDMCLCSTLAEISIVKSVMCVFDEICQAHYPDFVFTRHSDLAPIRNFLKTVIQQNKEEIDIKSFDQYYLGVLLDNQPIEKSLNFFGYDADDFEHIILISSNSATKTVDVLWNILGVEIHAIRLSTDWTGRPFCGVVANPIWGKEVTCILKMDEENPFLSITRSQYKSFGLNSSPAEEFPYVLAELREQAYYKAVVYVENNATSYQRKNFEHYVDCKRDANINLREFIVQRLIRFYKNSYRKEELDKEIDSINDVIAKWENVSALELRNFTSEKFACFISDYRKAFNCLNKTFHPPAKLVNKKIRINLKSPST